MRKNEKARLSPEAKTVWGALDEKTRKTIQKDNPFRTERDNAIRGLIARGVSYSVLEEITGMSDSRIREIANKIDIFTLMTQRKLDDLKKSFEVFHETLSMILKGRIRK
jgi:UDP-N-acetylmuramyl tripeptide synthase